MWRPLSRISPPGFGIAAECEVDEVADVPDAAAVLLHGADQGPASGDGLQAPGVAASAGDSGGGRNLGVPEFACGADGSALEHAAGDDARSQAGRGLDEQHVVEAVALPAPLGEHDHVGVVVEQDRGGGELA